jgi:hypothetical protein
MGIDNSKTGPDFATVDPSAAVDPSNQTATASPQMMQTPATPAPTQPAPAAPSVTTPPVEPSKNQRLHGFVASVLSGISSSLAGKPATRYTTDETGRVIADPNQPKDSMGQQGRRILGNALSGLAAGSQVPQKGSGLASALAGLGAGAGAQSAQATAADDKAKKEARENDEATQKRILQQHDIARTNALTYSTYSHDMREQDEHDPQRKKYSQWADAAEAGGLDVKTMSEKEAKTAASDPSFMANHLLLPGGFKPQTGPNGEVLMDPQTQQPLRDGQVLVIQGGHMDTSGNKVVELPASLVDDVHKYGDLLGIGNAKGLKEGDEVDAEHFFKLIGVAQEGNKAQQKGWLKPEISQDEKGNNFEKNTNTGEIRPAKVIPIGDATKLAAQKTAAARETETARHNRADEANKAAAIANKKAAADADHTDMFGNQSQLSEKEFNKRYDQFSQSKQNKDLQVLQGSYQQFQDIIKDIDGDPAKGIPPKDMTGAQSVVGLFNAIGISATPLAGKGFRINNVTVDEHAQARGITEAMKQKGLKAEVGDIITPKQLKDYAGIAKQVYENAYVNAANEQRRAMGYIDALPQGNGQPLDPEGLTHRIYLRAANGDANKAAAAERAQGWTSSGGQNTAPTSSGGQKPNLPPAPSGMVTMQKPDGNFVHLPQADVAAAVKAGGKVVQ